MFTYVTSVSFWLLSHLLWPSTLAQSALSVAFKPVENVTIDSQYEVFDDWQRHYEKSSSFGLTLGLS